MLFRKDILAYIIRGTFPFDICVSEKKTTLEQANCAVLETIAK